MKTKRSLSLILAVVMLLAMSFGAWAAAVELPSANWNQSIDVTGANTHGTTAGTGGKVVGVGNITTDGIGAFGAYVYDSSDLTLTGNISTNGSGAHGAYAYTNSTIHMSGDITVNLAKSYGVYSRNKSYIKYQGDIVAIGDSTIGVMVFEGSASADIVGAITTSGDAAHGVLVRGEGSSMDYSGDITINGPNSRALAADQNGALVATGTVVVNGGPDSYGIYAQNALSTVTVTNSTITINNDSSWGILMGGGATINLSNTAMESENLLLCGLESPLRDSKGTVNISNGSELAGEILHVGTTSDALTINLTGSTWTGPAEASGDIGAIDINLEGSTWNVSGDSNTNGKLTGDSDSKVDFNGTDDNITVIIDSLEGDPSIDMKVGDTLIIKNSDGSITDISSSDPDVVEVIVDPDTGEITIVSKGDGDMEITYTKDGETNTIGVTSGAGSEEPVDPTVVTPTITGTPADGIIYPGETVDLTYDFGDDYTVDGVDDSGLAGSGLTATRDENGNVVLSGTATNPGTYYYEVTLIGSDGKPFTQRIPVVIQSGSRPSGDPTRGHGSSGCNAGLGVLALLGLAFVTKRK